MAFPNFQGKHEHESLFTPYDYLEYAKRNGSFFKMPESLVFIYSEHLLSELKENWNFYSESWNWPMYKIGGTKGKIGVVVSFIGSPAATTLLEEAIVFGAKRVISMGTAGGLQFDLTPGDVVVCDKAIRDEGTSHHYLASSKYALPSKNLTEALIKNLGDKKIDFKVGPSWTIDAPYRETKAEIERYREEGIYAVEMEASALFSVGQYRKIDVASAFVISDIVGKKWEPNFQERPVRESLSELFGVCVATLEGFDG